MCCDLSGAVLLHVLNSEGFDSAVATSESVLLLGRRFAGASSVFGWTKKGGKTRGEMGDMVVNKEGGATGATAIRLRR